jgi:hypothetical protein
MGLSSHANVYNTCLRILRHRGFDLRLEGELLPDGSYPPDPLWIAEKSGFRFCADNPIELLGLTAVYDHVHPATNKSYWWRVEGPDIWEELQKKAFEQSGDAG